MADFMFMDDYMFPTTRKGMVDTGMLLESRKCYGCKEEDDDDLFEDALTKDIRNNSRKLAMSAVLYWIDNGEYSYDTFDLMIQSAADVDDDEEIVTDEEEAYYNDIWSEVGDAFIYLGADADLVQKFVDGPSKDADNAGERLGSLLADSMNEEEASDNDLIVDFAFGDDTVFESSNYIKNKKYRKNRARRRHIEVHHGKKVIVGPKRIKNNPKLKRPKSYYSRISKIGHRIASSERQRVRSFKKSTKANSN